MKIFLQLSTLLVFVLILSSCLKSPHEKDFDSSFTHTVLFWLHNPDSKEDKLVFEKSLKKFLNNSQYAKTKFIGVPAKTHREVVDNSFTYSLLLTFPSKEIQDKYQKEEAHILFIKESSHLWEKVQVYDSVNLNDVN